MELHTPDRKCAMPHAHDFAIIRPGRHPKLVRAASAIDRERMVAGRIVGCRQSAEHASPAMVDARDLPVHQFLRVYDSPAERLANGLVTQAHTEDRDAALEALDERE